MQAGRGWGGYGRTALGSHACAIALVKYRARIAGPQQKLVLFLMSQCRSLKEGEVRPT